MTSDQLIVIIALVALAVFAVWLAYMIYKEEDRDFDGGFEYMNKPRVKTKMTINNKEEEYK